MGENALKGWEYIVYTLINKNFKNDIFKLKDIYVFEEYFQSVYPANLNIDAKIRQTLQYLRDKDLLIFISRGKYQLIRKNIESQIPENDNQKELIYLLSNECMPGWVKIGRTNSLKNRMKSLYNTSMPLPFKLEAQILTNSHHDAIILEKSLHNIIDTINPDLRKNTEGKKREFFMLTIDEGKNIFKLVEQILGVSHVDIV